MTPLPKYGLYAITDSTLTPEHSLVEQVTEAIRGGAAVIQYRDKNATHAEKRQRAIALQNICHQHNIPFIVNDDIALAKELNADGVHLGADDSSIVEARRRLGKNAIIGASCYNDFQLALEAQQHGASYIAFGRFFPSDTKPSAVQADVTLIQRAKEILTIPVVAIGGITPENGHVLVDAGADFLAVVAGIFAANDPHHAARQYAEIFHKHLNT